MRDHVDKDGFLYRNAYPFHKPETVRVCVCWWRLPVFAPLRLLASLFFWLFFGGIFAVFTWGILGIPCLLGGEKYVYDKESQVMEDNDLFPGVIAAKALDRLVIMNYREVSIESLLVVGGKRILPWHILAFVIIPFALWYGVPVAGSAIDTAAHGIWAGITGWAAEFMAMSLWLPISIVAGIAILLFVVYGIQEFRKSEMWGLIKLSAKAKADKVCPILPVK